MIPFGVMRNYLGKPIWIVTRLNHSIIGILTELDQSYATILTLTKYSEFDGDCIMPLECIEYIYINSPDINARYLNYIHNQESIEQEVS